MGGAMIAPISESETMVRRCPKWSGVSRTIKIRRRRSFSDTSAARVSKLEQIPAAIADIVWIEHGATTMPSVRKEPLASRHPMSSKL